tara:strand:- start:6728 stop:7144 length:417 start_codon:yes stop_codon:yes gene_type:complete
MSDSAKKAYEMSSTSPDVKIDYEEKVNNALASSHFKETYPIIEEEFSKTQKELYNLFSKKMMDYGLGNIALGGNLESPEDQKYALQGIQIRLNDKINRLKNLLKNDKSYVEDESLEDTFIDIANYGIIGILLGKGKWK